jgi:putative hydrolase of the HAD superfamily
MCIALDMDDTLYLERDYVRSGFRAVDEWLAAHYDFNGFFQEAWRLFESGARGTIFDHVLETRDIHDSQIIQKMVNVYRRHEPDIQLLPDARRFLEKFDKTNLALITDGPAVSQWAKINALNLENHIGLIIVTENLGAGCGKPSSQAYLKAQGGCDPSSCIYIGDNPRKDFQGPKSLNWKPSIRIRRVGSLHYDQPTPADCTEINSFDELPGNQILAV